ncbi:MAG: GIY-YIG nuclease family protein [Candidatus Liptonbacteria bacterium]|nr:GIY-YIG nuclease family protein [Candidatus Liptonbacteria bacterium]
MFYVYVLQSKKDKSFYIGFAPNLRERLVKHSKRLVQSTKHLLPMTLIYFESYRSKTDALNREKQLKRFAKGFYSLKRRLRESMLEE